MIHTPRWKKSLTNVSKEAATTAQTEFRFTDYSDTNRSMSKYNKTASSFDRALVSRNKKHIVINNNHIKNNTNTLPHLKRNKVKKIISEQVHNDIQTNSVNKVYSRRASVLSKILESPKRASLPKGCITERNQEDNETTKFLKLIANLSEQPQNSLVLTNELRKLKTTVPKAVVKKLPVFMKGTQLNNYLIRGFHFNSENAAEAKKLTKEKERITQATYQNEYKMKKKRFDVLTERYNLEHEPEKKKIRSRKTTQKRLSIFSQLIQEHHKKQKSILKEKLTKMSDQLLEFNKTDYVDLSNRPNEVNRKNLHKVIDFLKIVKLKQESNDAETDKIVINDKFFDDCLKHEFEAMKTLKMVGNVKYLKLKLRSNTIKKFFSINGHYL